MAHTILFCSYYALNIRFVLDCKRLIMARAWQRMLSGRRLDLLNPSPVDIEIEDIAHGLARVARWNGQTMGDHAFSVAQHSVVVESVCAELEPGLRPGVLSGEAARIRSRVRQIIARRTRMADEQRRRLRVDRHVSRGVL